MKRLAMTALCASFVWASGCGSNGGSSSTVTSPSGLNLAGTWSGTFGPFAATINGVPLPGRSNSWTCQWVAMQTGVNVSGPITFLVNTELSQPFPTLSGTLSGSLTGTQLTLALSVPSQGFSLFSPCSISSNGSVTAGTGTISGSLSDSFASCLLVYTPCDTVPACIAAGRPSNSQLTLNKQ